MSEGWGDGFADENRAGTDELSNLTTGDPDDGRGIINDTLDTVEDYGQNMATTGEALFDTVTGMAGQVAGDTLGTVESIGSDIVGGHPLDALEDLGKGVFNDTTDILGGLGGESLDLLQGLGTTAFAAGHDALDVGEDIVGDLGSGAEDVADAIGDGASDVVDEIGDIGSDIEDLF